MSAITRMLKDNIKRILHRLGIRRDMHRDYRLTWVSAEGDQYRRQYLSRRAGETDLPENPSVEQVKADLMAALGSDPAGKRILEVGCGWGKIMKPLSEYFSIEGCDVSPQMLEFAESSLVIHQEDIANPSPELLAKRFDIIFTVGVVMYMVSDVDVLIKSLKNMCLLAKTKVILYETPDVCEIIRRHCQDEKIVCVEVVY